MQRLLLFGAVAVLTAGCGANHNSIYRTTKLEDTGTQLIDAKQRAIVVWPNVTTTSTTKTSPGRVTTESTETVTTDVINAPAEPAPAPGARASAAGTKVTTTNRVGSETTTSTVSTVSKTLNISICAEPSPDAFTVLAASGELSVSNPAGVSAAGSLASTETGASLSRRTTTILAQRDAYFRLCEARANGWIDDIDLMVGQRHNQLSLVGMLAIEQLTGAVSAPAVSIGGSANAVSASAVQAIASARTAELLHNKELKDQLKDAKATQKTKQDELGAHKLPDGADTAAKTAFEAKKAELEKAVKVAEDKVTKLQAEVETSDKVLAAYDKALDGAATGSSAASMPALIVPQPDPAAQAAVAKSVVEIVQMINSNDMGPTICLRYLRDRVGLSKDGQVNCEDILAEYASGLQARVGAYTADTLLKQELVRALVAIKNPGDPKVYKEQVKPILDLLLAIKEKEPATVETTIKSDGPPIHIYVPE